MKKLTILIVDDEKDWRDIWKERMRRNELRCVEASTLTQATELIKKGNVSFDGAIIDKGGKNPLGENPHWKYHDGLRVLEQLREFHPACRTVLVTGESFGRSVFESTANAFADKGKLETDTIIEFLKRGPLTPNDEGKSIINLDSPINRGLEGIESSY